MEQSNSQAANAIKIATLTPETPLDIDIATATSRMAKIWANRRTTWAKLAERLSHTIRTPETVAEYRAMSRDDQSRIKDVGGFVGGYLTDGRRKTGSVAYRTLATLDIDYGTPDTWERFTAKFAFAAVLYSTHKHTADKPRYRLVFPLSRKVKPEEYEPLCRRVAAAVGIELFDTTTYQLARLFYWPSTSNDGDYVYRKQEGPACDVDSLLGLYHDYRDASAWPVSEREGHAVRHEIKKAGDPLMKNGLIGAFCRAYTISEAIATFLPDIYEPTTTEGRYTYVKGHVAGGLVCYDDKFAYSHHDTDPASRQLCNAFDLVRIHLYGDADENSRVEEVTRLPSYKRMCELVAKDESVRRLLATERLAEARSDFALIEAEPVKAPKAKPEKPDDTAWLGQLECGKDGKALATIANAATVLENDPNFKGRLWHNQFSGFDIIRGGLPWDKRATQWSSSDDNNLRAYLERCYGLTGKDKIKDALVSVFTRHQSHPIRDYLNSLKWDGRERLDRLIIDYLGAEDNELTRAMTRKQFAAAVARVMRPGCKYDYCLILSGPEGIGKSTLCALMGGEWFSDSLYTMEDKAGMEQLRGGWIIELPELGSLKRSEVEQVKAFITRQNDIYRPAYGSVLEQHPRQCVFFGTTNETYFLKGDTGNRRFWVVPIQPDLRKVSDPREALAADRDQIWAEAVTRYKAGEQLYLSPELEKLARERQDAFNDNSDDPLPDMVHAFLDRSLPANWPAMDLYDRRNYVSDNDPLSTKGDHRRDVACAAEFICEDLRRSRADKEYKYLARKVSKIMADTPGWEPVSSSKHARALYGIQRAYKRVEEDPEDDL